MSLNNYTHIDTKICTLLLLLIGFLFFSNKSQACDYVNTGLWSYHFNRDKVINETSSGYYNETNKRVGCEGLTDYKISVGTFDNSFGWETWYISKHYYSIDKPNIKAGIEYGLWHGYRGKQIAVFGDINPFIAPHVDVKIPYTPVWIQFYSLLHQGVAAGIKWEL